MRVDEVMTRFPPTIRLGSDLRRAAEMIGASEVGQLMVLDHDGRFAGVLSEGDVVRAVLPRPDEIRELGGSLAAAFEAVRSKGRDLATRDLDPLVLRDAITLRPDEDVAAAAVVMADRRIRRLPVVEEGQLRGTVSRNDLCRALIAHG